MTTIQILGTLATLQPDWMPANWGWRRSPTSVVESYETIYRTQPNVRICVDFLARNIAQLGLHTYRRVSDTDRERLRDHGLAQILGRPNAWTTGYAHREWTVHDLGVHGKAFWLKWRDRQLGLQLVRIPPRYIRARGSLALDGFDLYVTGGKVELGPDQVIYLRFPDPDNPLGGLSPIETLRGLLEEDTGSVEFRRSFWDHAAKPGGYIYRAKDAPPWDDDARDRFLADFEINYSGPENSGKTILLEDGMTFQQASQTAEESEVVDWRRLTREDVARAYHIPPPMVGILDHATFSNIREQHKNLYQDALGPYLKMIEEEIELQLLPEFTDTRSVYVEFNIAEKLAGSFEEQVDALQTSIGRPWMTADEGRGRLNLPSMGGEAEELAVPINMRVGEAEPVPAALPAGGEA